MTTPTPSRYDFSTRAGAVTGTVVRHDVLPDVYVGDGGDVEVLGRLMPQAKVLEWVRAVADQIEQSAALRERDVRADALVAHLDAADSAPAPDRFPVERYDLGNGITGAVLRGTTLPDVHVDDNGTVELSHYGATWADALAWARALADHIEARMDAS